MPKQKYSNKKNEDQIWQEKNSKRMKLKKNKNLSHVKQITIKNED